MPGRGSVLGLGAFLAAPRKRLTFHILLVAGRMSAGMIFAGSISLPAEARAARDSKALLTGH